MVKTIRDICEGFAHTVHGDENQTVGELRFRSNEVQPGDAFFCIVGFVTDGHKYAQDAVNRGARTLFVERLLELENAQGVTQVVCESTRDAMALASAAFFDHASGDFKLVGITGTNGKTTTTFLLEHIVSCAGGSCGVIGTTGNKVGGVMETAANTTPESRDLQALFARMRDAGSTHVAIEVSSHALDLRRPLGSRFAVTAFTNLTQDHLDYHHTFEAYFEAKALLFGPDYPAKRVICVDDEWGAKLAERSKAAGDDVLTTGFDPNADVHVLSVDYSQTGTQLSLSVHGEEVSFAYPLVGRFNVSNMMTALGIGMQLGFTAQQIADWMADMPGVPGRLDRVRTEHDGGISVYVDYAHTPDALEKAVAAVKSFTQARTLVVFGCGGDRDATKRPLMGGVALNGDFAIVTSDNPRTEDPDAIIADVVAGMQQGKDRYEVVPDRRSAIARAIELAQPGDAILVAGKGHEDYQIIGTTKIHFDDRETVAEELERRFGAKEA